VHPFSQKPWPLFLNFPKKNLKKNSKIKKFKKIGTVCRGSGVGLRLVGDHWSPPGSGPSTLSQQPLVAEPPASVGRGPWAGRRPTVTRRRRTGARALTCNLKKKFLLPSFFCACGQLIFIGSSTCPPCPDFA
jgi:hypothetical protein